ncbi:MAG: AMP-binding protein [Burkholderiales bacterium]|nr:AMP-binding protein [Burkholderiales bacterium]
MINVAANRQRDVVLLPEKTAIAFGDRRLSDAELDGAADRVANGPGALGMGSGGRWAKPSGGTEARIADGKGAPVPPGAEGEVMIPGHSVRKGHYTRPEATAKAIRDGRFHGRRHRRMDERGNVRIVDRREAMIVRGGLNAYPRGPEEVPMTRHAIAHAAVIGVPHQTHGEQVKAGIVLNPGKTAPADAIVAWCRVCKAAYKSPRRVEIVASLPMTATGEIRVCEPGRS